MVVGLIVTVNTDRPASYKAAGHLSEIICRLQQEHTAAVLALLTSHTVCAINI